MTSNYTRIFQIAKCWFQVVQLKIIAREVLLTLFELLCHKMLAMAVSQASSNLLVNWNWSFHTLSEPQWLRICQGRLC